MMKKMVLWFLIAVLLFSSCSQRPAGTEPGSRNLLDVSYLAKGYQLQQVLPTAYGLPMQLALLPSGDIALGATDEQVYLITNGSAKPIDTQADYKPAVAALPNGLICCCKTNGQLILYNPISNVVTDFGKTTLGDSASALISDKDGNVYAATAARKLYRFDNEGKRTTIAASLPFDKTGYSITDMDVADDGTIYVTGYRYAVAVKPDGTIKTIASDLQNDPNWCEISPAGTVYIKDMFSGIRRYNPLTDTLIPIKTIKIDTGVSDFLAISDNEFIFAATGVDMIVSYNVLSGTAVPLIVNAVNSFAFAAGNDNAVFLATPGMPELKSHIIKVNADGTKQDLYNLSYLNILSANIDPANRLCLATDEGFYRVETDGTITQMLSSTKPGNVFPNRFGDFAVGPDGKWYCISTDFNDTIKVYCFDELGNVSFLPISFNRASFGNAFQVADARIDVGSNGKLALIVTAVATPGQGPLYQRVYRANPDGSDLALIANLDCVRTSGMEDITVGPDNDIYVFTLQKNTEIVYRIDQNNKVFKFIVIATGRDPKSIDMDFLGNLWICTTVGIFRAQH